MLEVYFKFEKEVISFCENLFRYNKQIELNWKTHKDWGNQLQFKAEILNDSTIESMARAMVDVYVTHRLFNTLKAIIRNDYYYSNTDEIEKILDLTHWIYKEAELKNNLKPHQLLLSLFMKHIKNTSPIHFDSIVQFRLNSFRNLLLDYVGLAIDEFKQEEDHQAFIDMLRKYIAKKEPTYHEIHILQGKNFTFFKSSGKRFSTLELRSLMHEEPLYIVGLDIEELNLAPLIAIAPKKINIYGDNPSEPKTLTVINVFQERVTFEPFSRFPFPHYLGTH